MGEASGGDGFGSLWSRYSRRIAFRPGEIGSPREERRWKWIEECGSCNLAREPRPEAGKLLLGLVTAMDGMGDQTLLLLLLLLDLEYMYCACTLVPYCLPKYYYLGRQPLLVALGWPLTHSSHSTYLAWDACGKTGHIVH